MLLDRAAMVASGKVIPGQPEKSPLYRRVTGELEPMMPEGGPRLPDSELAALKRWIDEGAPQWNAQPAPRRRFISNDEVVAAIEQDLISFDGEASRSWLRYFVLTNLYNTQDAKLGIYRAALFKMLNSLSWEHAILKPVAIDKEETIFRVDLRDFDWSDATWRTILSGYPYGVRLPTAGYTHIQRMTASNVPFIRADWFLVAASLPPLYHDILELPPTERELENCGPGVRRCLHVDTARNLRDAAGVRVARSGFTESGVSNNNRIVERHRSSFGAYWKSFDFPDNVGAHNIFQRPMDFERAGGEIIFNLPNGLQAYLLVDQRGNRIDQAPTNIVFNKSAGRPEIRNGQSCMACHVNGMRPLSDDVRATLSSLAPDLRRQAMDLYVDNAVMKGLLLEDQKRFENAVRETGGRPGEEPLVEVSQRYQASLNAAGAAAELGLTEGELLERLAGNPQLQQLGMATLMSGGAIKRDTWESEFGRIAEATGLGSYERPTRVFGERFFAGPGGIAPPAPATVISFAPSVRPINLPPITFVRVEPGTFQMGCSPDDTQCDADEKAPHPVRISRRFEIGSHEVTQSQWRAVMGNNPSAFKGDNRPVDSVSWNDVRDFLNRLNAQNDGFRYRLPTEAEWEFAARAGSGAAATEGRDNVAWFLDNASKQTQPVGGKQANAWGLFDMQGNVAEWVQDGYTSFYAPGLAIDPAGPPNNSTARVIRGGSWNDGLKEIRVSRRDAINPFRRFNFIGFRVVREATR
jgi:hypothetical protein